ncbi:glycosyltransferase, partial [Campylobacter jejuni]
MVRMNKKLIKNSLLIMAATHDYLFSVANVLIGLKKYSPNMFDDIVIYTDSLAKESDLNALKKIFSNIIFKVYTFQLDNVIDRERLKYYSNMPYARFEMLTYLNEYKKVVWFDSDFLIVDDISGLLNYGKTGIAMSIDLDPYPINHDIKPFFVKNVDEYNMNAKAYASGLIVFSNALKEPLKIRDFLYEKLNYYSSYIKYAEQGILQFMIEEFNLEVDEIPKLVFHTFPFEEKINSKLIHLLGDSKPWLNYSGSAYDEWYENHKEWIKLGGSEAYSFEILLDKNHHIFYDCYEFFEKSKYKKYFFGERRYQNLLYFKYMEKLCSNNIVNIHIAPQGAVEKVKTHLSYKLGKEI